VDPLSREATSAVGLVHYYRREYDQAIAALRKTLELDPTFGEAHAELASVYEVAGRFPDALAETRKLEDLGAAERVKCHTARIYARMGKREEARKVLAAGCPGSPVSCSATQLALGNADQAIAELQRAIPAHDNHLIWLRSDPMFDPLKNDPRFVAILKQINLQ
jgi:tetratricopeptide (TPR) repeat protein